MIDFTSSPAERMAAVLCAAYRGAHHVPGEVHKDSHRWVVNVDAGIATFDFDNLTRLVLAAHHYAVRVQLNSSGPRQIKLVLHPRQRDAGGISGRHPTIEEAAEAFTYGLEELCREWNSL